MISLMMDAVPVIEGADDQTTECAFLFDPVWATRSSRGVVVAVVRFCVTKSRGL